MITDWSQTNTELSIFIPILYKVDVKKVDYVITEAYVKLNIPEMKLIKFVDLEDKVDISQSKMVIEERRIIFILKKPKEGLWKELSYKGTKEEIRQRRKEAEAKYEEKIKSDRELAAKTKQEFSKFVVDQSIKIDDEKRNELLSKKKQEKVDAEKDLYQFVEKIDNSQSNTITTKSATANSISQPKITDEDDEIIQSNTNTKPKINRLTDEIDDIPYIESKPIQNSIISDKPKASLSQQLSSITKRNEIFTDEDIKKKEQIHQPLSNEPMPNKGNEQSSAIRQQSNIPVSLTEKKIPTFAARESLSKEPPYPKSKKYVPEKNYVRHLYLISLLNII